MPTVPISDQPAFISTIDGESVAVVNTGTMAVWLDADIKVTPGQGYVLNPGDDIQWTGPLFAVCQPSKRTPSLYATNSVQVVRPTGEVSYLVQ